MIQQRSSAVSELAAISPALPPRRRRYTPSAAVHPNVLLEPDFPYGEELLQSIWEQRVFDQHALRTADGQAVEVIRPGRIQHNSGPDLSGAELRIGDQHWAGTVEVHLRSSDWNAHGHQFDPAYENVILHVVYHNDTQVLTAQGRSLPTLELFTRISTKSIALHLALMRSTGFVPCASSVDRVDAAEWGMWLERVLIERLERKTEEIEALFRQLNCDPAETTYHMLARAFGFKVNAEPFGMLANALPLRIIRRYRDDSLRTEALLFGQSGLIRVDLLDQHPRRLQLEHGVLAQLHGLRPAPMAAWKFARMRPVNFPTLRIAQFAQLLVQLDGDPSQLLECDDVNELYRLLDVEAGPYWNTHYTFDTSSATRNKRLGRSGADHLIINAIVPTLFALGRSQGRSAYEERALKLLVQLPPEANSIVRGWAQLGINADSAGRGQALLELKNSYCSLRACLSCRIGNQLLKNTV